MAHSRVGAKNMQDETGSKEMLKNQNDMHMSQGYRSQQKELLVAKTGTVGATK
jgi:hypothetical protein